MNQNYRALLALLSSEPESPDRQRRLTLLNEMMTLCNEIVLRTNDLFGSGGRRTGGLGALFGSLHELDNIRALFEKLGIYILEFRKPYIEVQTGSVKELQSLKLSIERFTIGGWIAILIAAIAFTWFMKGLYDSVRVLL